MMLGKLVDADLELAAFDQWARKDCRSQDDDQRPRIIPLIDTGESNVG